MKRFHNWILVLILLLPYPGAFAAAVQAGAAQPRAAVDRLQEALIETMKQGGSLGYAGRYDELEPVVLDTHDLEGALRVAVGRHWEQLTEDERARLLAAFKRQSVAEYAGRFERHSGEEFEFIEQEPGRRGRVVIRSRLLRPGEESIAFIYVLHEVDGAWRILNIVVDGVSDLALKRAEYTSILKTAGVDVLVKKIDAKTAKLATD
jgi:phospholipid transport system substrate-binding protein